MTAALELLQRLEAAERVCVLFGWSVAREDTEMELATSEAWMRWTKLVPDRFLEPASQPDLSEEVIKKLAGDRARTLADTRHAIERALAAESES